MENSILTVEGFTQRLRDAGHSEKAEMFLKAYGNISGYVEKQLFLCDAVCRFLSVPQNNGTAEWAAYVATGDINKWKMVREQRLKNEAAKEQV